MHAEKADPDGPHLNTGLKNFHECYKVPHGLIGFDLRNLRPENFFDVLKCLLPFLSFARHEGLLVYLQHFLRDCIENGIKDELFLDREEGERCAEQHEVQGALVAGIDRELSSVEGEKCFNTALDGIMNLNRVFFRSNGDADSTDGTRVIDNCAVGFQKMQIPGGFQGLESDEQVRLPLGHERGKHLVAEPHLRQYAAAALRHAVDFTLLDVKPGKESGLGNDLAREQHALPAHA